MITAQPLLVPSRNESAFLLPWQPFPYSKYFMEKVIPFRFNTLFEVLPSSASHYWHISFSECQPSMRTAVNIESFCIFHF